MPTSYLIGGPKTAVDTPALLVDLDIMEGNIRRVMEICRANGVGWRPHTKGQKTVEIIQKELAAGAIGVTCAKLGEAEVLAANRRPRHPDPQPDRRSGQDGASRRADRDRGSDRRRGQHRTCRTARRGDARHRAEAARGDRGGYRHAPCRRAARRARGVIGPRDRRPAGACGSSA